jgi:hypothetical protein
MNNPVRFLLVTSLCGASFAQQADLRVTALDATGVVGDHQGLTIGGSVAVSLENAGSGGTGAGFDVLLFEDANANGTYDAGTDRELGATSVAALGAGAMTQVNVGVSGLVDRAAAAAVRGGQGVTFTP